MNRDLSVPSMFGQGELEGDVLATLWRDRQWVELAVRRSGCETMIEIRDQ